jgi:hypothetical protein
MRKTKTGALVMKLSGIGHVLSNVAQDYGGQNSMQDATCECSETFVRRYGLPCAHNIAHAEKAGMTAESIVHWKDTTVAWKCQYAGLEFPVLSMFNIDSSDLIDPVLTKGHQNAAACSYAARSARSGQR